MAAGRGLAGAVVAAGRAVCWWKTWTGASRAVAAAAAAAAVERLSAAMRRAEEAMRAGMEIGLLVKDFFEGPVEAVLQRMAGPGGRRPGVSTRCVL